MSDTLQEREDARRRHEQIGGEYRCNKCRAEFKTIPDFDRHKCVNDHQVTKSGACVIPGCPCRGWSAQEIAIRDYPVSKTTTEFDMRSDEHQPATRGGGNDGDKPLAYIRRWAYEGRVPEKVKNAKGRWVWPREAMFHDVTKAKVCADDIPLYASNQHQALVAERERWERLKSKIAWHRDGVGPDVPVLQERYDRVIKERNELRGEQERLVIAAKAAVERLADLPRYLEKNGTDALATMTAECLADLAVAIPAEQRSTSA